MLITGYQEGELKHQVLVQPLYKAGRETGPSPITAWRTEQEGNDRPWYLQNKADGTCLRRGANEPLQKFRAECHYCSRLRWVCEKGREEGEQGTREDKEASAALLNRPEWGTEER